MKIYPPNLGKRYHVSLVRDRSGKPMKEPDFNDPLPAPKLGFLGNIWAKGSSLTTEQAAQAAPAAGVGTRAIGIVTTVFGSMLALVPAIVAGETTHSALIGLGAFAASMAGIALVGYGPFARSVFLRAHKELTVGEVDALLKKAPDELHQAYLELVRAAVLVEVPSEVQSKIQEALTYLGEAIDSLPVVALKPQDTDAFRTQASALQAEATAESDPVISESLRRRAESLVQRAESQERSALLVRRTRVLREEILAKIEALRDALAAQQTGSLDATALNALSESARNAALESQNASSARNEMERYLSPQTEEASAPQNLQR